MKWFIKCLKQYADFEGRARRKEYWWFILINFIISMILLIGWMVPFFKMAFVAASTGSEDFNPMEVLSTMMKNPFMYLYLVYYLAVLIPSIAVMVRRLHDTGKSGLWVFLLVGGSILGSFASLFQTISYGLYVVLALVCIATTILGLVWLFTDSQYGPNQYGPNPKGEGNNETPVETE